MAGAVPVLMGWTAVGGRPGLAAATLFLIVFLWQFPHFMAIAWIYRQQYAAAGMQMLPVVDPSGRRAGVQAVCLGAGLGAGEPGAGGGQFCRPDVFWLGLGPGRGPVGVCRDVFVPVAANVTARVLLRASLVYLPTLLLMLMLGHGLGFGGRCPPYKMPLFDVQDL